MHSGPGDWTVVTGWQKLVLGLAVCLPVPALAVSGLALPLPDAVYRAAAAIVQETEQLAGTFVGHDRESNAVALRQPLGTNPVNRSAASPASTENTRARARGGGVATRKSVAARPKRSVVSTSVPASATPSTQPSSTPETVARREESKSSPSSTQASAPGSTSAATAEAAKDDRTSTSDSNSQRGDSNPTAPNPPPPPASPPPPPPASPPPPPVANLPDLTLPVPLPVPVPEPKLPDAPSVLPPLPGR